MKDRLQLGAWLGMGVVAVAIGLILWDLGRGPTGGHLPPIWYGGSYWTPLEQQICAADRAHLPISVSEVEVVDGSYREHCWERWPAPQVVRCQDSVAPDGVVRWHSCDELRPGPSGAHQLPYVDPEAPTVRRDAATYVRRAADGSIVAADIYLREGYRPCVPLHEMAHARGYVDPEGGNSHTTLRRSLLYAECPDDPDWVWIDRCEPSARL